MEKYSYVERLSTTVPQAVIRWPDGFTDPPEIYPLDDSLEQSNAVRQFLEELQLWEGFGIGLKDGRHS